MSNPILLACTGSIGIYGVTKGATTSTCSLFIRVGEYTLWLSSPSYDLKPAPVPHLVAPAMAKALEGALQELITRRRVPALYLLDSPYSGGWRYAACCQVPGITERFFASDSTAAFPIGLNYPQFLNEALTLTQEREEPGDLSVAWFGRAKVALANLTEALDTLAPKGLNWANIEVSNLDACRDSGKI